VTHPEDKLLHETPYLNLVQRGKWFLARRPNTSAVICVAAVTEKGLLLVEQYRPAVQCNTIECPAGLAGDIVGQENEAPVEAAKRELLEETGYVAETWDEIMPMPSSAGMTDELITMFRAQNLTRQHEGGGDETEDITVHEVPLTEVNQWLFTQHAAGKLVDARVFAALYFLTPGGFTKSRSDDRY